MEDLTMDQWEAKPQGQWSSLLPCLPPSLRTSLRDRLRTSLRTSPTCLWDPWDLSSLWERPYRRALPPAPYWGVPWG